MINSSELRKGNKIFSEFESVGIIIEIYETEVLIEFGPDNTRDVYADVKLKPIYLTSKILEKCGFEPEEADFKIGDFKIYSRHNVFWFWYQPGVTDGQVNLKYLHQLQNLYFVLTGKELTVNI